MGAYKELYVLIHQIGENMEERRGGFVIHKQDEDVNYLGDKDNFKEFKKEVTTRLEKLEKDIKDFKAVKK